MLQFVKKYFLLILIPLGITIIYFRCTSWYQKLSGQDGHLTVAHVYNLHTIKWDTYYDYIYKVGENYYTESTTKNNMNSSNDSLSLQSFLVSYYLPDPTIHTVIWSYQFDTILPLGLNLDSVTFDKSLIRKHTLGWNGLSPRSKANDTNEIANYQRIAHRKMH
jgi:hypothetical protein